MKPTIFLVPAAFLSTVLAWGRGKDANASNPNEPVLPTKGRRYDYKQSLKKPFQYNDAIPFWGQHGNTFVAQDFVRLAPSVPKLRGSVWRSAPNEYKEWEVEFSFRAHGQSPFGGRGFAFWYTQDRAMDGPVFGSKDKWKGLGLFMDTSDPANQ
ncbi:Protein ERGIC-53, partial [Podila humilis]